MVGHDDLLMLQKFRPHDGTRSDGRCSMATARMPMRMRLCGPPDTLASKDFFVVFQCGAPKLTDHRKPTSISPKWT